jgi:archaetidylinositol phosphate synthase
MVQRSHLTITGKAERSVLDFLCRRVPDWLTSDMLTAVGLFGAGLACLSYCLARINTGFFWLAIVGLVVNWLGDSLDGSLARFRAAERPQYGFFLDHTVDGFAMALVASGVGLSPMAHFWCALLALMGYYLLTILSLTTCLATGVFKVSFGGVGPTEIRLGIISATIAAALLPIGHADFDGVTLSVYDGVLLALSAGLVIMAMTHTVQTAKKLAISDPMRYKPRKIRHIDSAPPSSKVYEMADEGPFRDPES